MAKALIQDFTQGELFKPMLKFSIPFMLSNALHVLYSMTDMLIVGKFTGSAGISAVMSGGFLVMFLTMTGMGMATGGQVMVSQLIGKGEKERLKTAIASLMTMSLVIAVVMSVLSVILAPWLMKLMKIPAALPGERITFIFAAAA